MKTVFLALTISCAAFLHETSYAAPVDAGPQQVSSESSANAGNNPRDSEQPAADGKQTDGKLSDDEGGDRVHGSERNRSHTRIGITSLNRPARIPQTGNLGNGNVVNAHQARSIRPRGLAREGDLQSERREDSALPTRPPGVFAHRGSLASDVRHRGPNTAVVDGSMNPNIRSTGEIHGSRMHHKP